ncbi:MAG: NAD+ synthase [Gemmatimonadetes bacterium]|nr:NAD+ synthase [Gemmatimonadota bacterium]
MPSIRIAVAQIRPTKGEYAANLDRLAGVLQQVTESEPPVQLVVAPETATSGYFLEGGVRDVAVTAGTLFQDLQDRYAGISEAPIDVAVGFYEVFQNRHYNACLYATLGKKGKVRHVHRKVFLPTYGVFDEERFVDHGHDITAFDTGWGGRAAILICEDAWHSLSGTIAALGGAQVVIVPSAAPARGTGSAEDGTRLPASVVRWERLLRGIAEEHGVYVVHANLVGFEGGKGFPGGSSVIGPSGEMVVRGPLFEEAVFTADLDPDAITRARVDTPLLADLELVLPHIAKNLGKREEGRGKSKTVKFDPAVNGADREAAEHPLPSSLFPLPPAGRGVEVSDPLRMDCELVRRWLVSFLRDEIVLRRGYAKGIVGLSGGVDSALTAFLAAEALGRENVIGVRLPYRTSSPESLAHAQLVIDKLGIIGLTIDISAAVDGYLNALDGPVEDSRRANVTARERMIVVFDLSAKHRALPVGTSNKSERLLGYFTWHADDAPPVNPLGDLFKSQVWALARHVGVPEEIVRKPATADLIQGQTDEGDFGISYPRADLILYYLLQGFKKDEILARGFTDEEIDTVQKRLEGTHWKRKLPTVAMVSQTAIGEYYLRPVDY